MLVFIYFYLIICAQKILCINIYLQEGFFLYVLSYELNDKKDIPFLYFVNFWVKLCGFWMHFCLPIRTLTVFKIFFVYNKTKYCLVFQIKNEGNFFLILFLIQHTWWNKNVIWHKKESKPYGAYFFKGYKKSISKKDCVLTVDYYNTKCGKGVMKVILY